MDNSALIALGSLGVAALAILVTLRERASGPRAVLFERRLDATLELVGLMSEAIFNITAFEEPVPERTPDDRLEAVDQAQRFAAAFHRSQLILDEDSRRALVVVLETLAAALEGPGDTDAMDRAWSTALDALAKGVSVEPLGDSLRYITGQAGRDRDAAMLESYRQMGERLQRPRADKRD